MAKVNFYAVYGFNAVGVVVGWNRVERVRKYIHGMNTKKFTTFQEAERYALDIAAQRIPDMYAIPKHLQCNDVQFLDNEIKRKMIKYES